MELLGLNLFNILEQRGYKGLSIGLVKKVMRSMLIVIKETTDIGLIHTDYKPENLCISQDNSTMKVIDFGASRQLGDNTNFYIESRYYRAPELILHLPFDYKIDIWSAACVGFETFVGLPLFPGQNECHMMCLFDEIIGNFPSNMIEQSERKDNFFDSHGNILTLSEMAEINCFRPFVFNEYFLVKNFRETIMNYSRRPRPGSTEFAEREKFIDILDHMLVLDPAQRYTAEECLSHPFLAV